MQKVRATSRQLAKWLKHPEATGQKLPGLNLSYRTFLVALCRLFFSDFRIKLHFRKALVVAFNDWKIRTWIFVSKLR